MVCRSRRWYGTRTGVGFEQRVERRRRGRRRRRWRWLPGLSTLAGFVARRTATSARSPPFPLRHITRQTDALPSTVRKNGPAQGVHLTGHDREANVDKEAAVGSSACPRSSSSSSFDDHATFSSRLDPGKISMFDERIVAGSPGATGGAGLDRDACDDRAPSSRATEMSFQSCRSHHRPRGFPIILRMMPRVTVT